MNFCKILVFILLVMGGVFSPWAATAATYYVATTGNDANSGTLALPFLTIAKGLTVITAGDTLYLRGGTYTQNINSDVQTVPSGTSWSNAITIASYPGEIATLAPNSGTTIITLNGYNASADIQYIIFDRLTLSASNTRYAISWIGNPSAFDVHHIRFQNGEIKNSMLNATCMPGTGTDGQNVQLSGHHHEFIQSKNYAAKCSYGFYISGHDILLDGMEVFNNNRYGIQIYSSGLSTVSNNIIRNSRIYGNGNAAITVGSGSNNQVYNNLIYGNAGGIEFNFNDSYPNTQIYNNTIYNNTQPGIQIGASAQGAKVQNNIIYQNSVGNIVDYGDGSGTTFSNNLTTNPLFVNAAINEFALQATSPAINAGISLAGIFTTDFLGATRPSGAAWDIGAYEFLSTTASTDRYASPTGSGTTCSTGAPCSLYTAVGQAVAGEHVILKNGTYDTATLVDNVNCAPQCNYSRYGSQIRTVRSGTAGNPIVIRAENALQAILRPPLPAGLRKTVINIDHSYITVRGLVVDGQKYYHFLLGLSGGGPDNNGGTAGDGGAPAGVATLTNIIIEENQFINGGGIFTSIQDAENLILRHNLIQDLGYYSTDPCCGSAFYMGSPSGGNEVQNVEIYGNTIRNATNNAVDMKDPILMDNIDVHHNIIENHQWPWDHGHPYPSETGHGYNDGLLIMGATNSTFDDNIIRNSDSGSSTFKIQGNAANFVRRNVVMNAINPSHLPGNATPIFRTEGTASLAASQGNNNTYCALNNYSNHSDGTAGITFSGNLSNQALSVCNAEVNRILTEMAALPRFTAVSVPTPTALIVLSISN